MTEKSAIVEYTGENQHPIHWELGDSGAGPWHRTEPVSKEGSAHPNDTLEGTLQQG